MEEVVDAETGQVLMVYSGADCLAFPFVVPGYGVIVNHSAWQVFLSDYRSRCEALERITRYCQMQEVEKEMEE